MSTLAIIGIVIGTLVVACLFDHFFTKIFSGKKKEHTIQDYRDIVDKI